MVWYRPLSLAKLLGGRLGLGGGHFVGGCDDTTVLGYDVVDRTDSSSIPRVFLNVVVAVRRIGDFSWWRSSRCVCGLAPFCECVAAG